MKANEKATVLGAFCALLAVVALATPPACNKAAPDVNCLGTVGTSCGNQISPNCGSALYASTVKTSGTRKVVTGGSPGNTSTTNGAKCTGVCKITSDCEGLSPEVNVDGSANVTPSGTGC